MSTRIHTAYASSVGVSICEGPDLVDRYGENFDGIDHALVIDDTDNNEALVLVGPDEDIATFAHQTLAALATPNGQPPEPNPTDVNAHRTPEEPIPRAIRPASIHCGSTIDEAFVELLADEGIELSTDLEDPDALATPSETDPVVLIERSFITGNYWITSYPTPDDVAGYLDGQECPEDWQVIAIRNLRTGVSYTARTIVEPDAATDLAVRYALARSRYDLASGELGDRALEMTKMAVLAIFPTATRFVLEGEYSEEAEVRINLTVVARPEGNLDESHRADDWDTLTDEIHDYLTNLAAATAEDYLGCHDIDIIDNQPDRMA